jgi:hypothetical protein
MTFDKYTFKLNQLGADLALRAEGKVGRIVWFGTELLPSTGYGGALRAALEQAGVEYWHVPWDH